MSAHHVYWGRTGRATQGEDGQNDRPQNLRAPVHHAALILMARSRTRRRWSLVRPAIGPRTLIAHWRSISAVNSRGLAGVFSPSFSSVSRSRSPF